MRTVGKGAFELRTKRPSPKLDYQWQGPFSISRKMGFDNYELKLQARMKIHPVFHVNRLKGTKVQETTENLDVTEEEYDVEQILDKRIVSGATQYKVRWAGYQPEADTWEPVGNLNCPEKIREYQNSHQQSSPVRPARR